MIIGYFSLANAVTLAGLIFSVTSCALAVKGSMVMAVYMMFLAFVCDMFDGKLARRKKNRSENAKLYGIQLDSLCDLVSFGITPCFLAYHNGCKTGWDVLIFCFFAVCGAIRLAYFNTLAIAAPQKAKGTYRGLPIPSSMIVVTFLFTLQELGVDNSVICTFTRVLYIALAIGFVLNVKIKKSGMKASLILIGIEILMLFMMLIGSWANGDTTTTDTSSNSSASSNVSNESSNIADDSSVPQYSIPPENSDASNVSDTSEVSDVSSNDSGIDSSAVVSA